MKICVFGAGAIGGHLAARLAEAGDTVSVVARGAHLAAIRAEGLRFESGAWSRHIRPEAVEDAALLGQQDAVIVAVKAPAIEPAAGAIAALLGPETPVVFALNGLPWWYLDELRPEGAPAGSALRQAVPRRQVVGCVLYSSNTVVAPGVVRNDLPTANRFVLGELDGSASPRAAALAASITRGGAHGEVSADLRSEIWRKLLLNLMTMPVACLTGATSRRIGSNPELRPILLALAAEGTAVAAACGVTASVDPRRLEPGSFPDHKPSMLQDLEQGRRTEVDAVLGAVQEVGRQKDVATPTLDILLGLLRARLAELGLYP